MTDPKKGSASSPSGIMRQTEGRGLLVESDQVALEVPLQPGLLAAAQEFGAGWVWGWFGAGGDHAPGFCIGPQAGAGDEGVFQRVAFEADQTAPVEIIGGNGTLQLVRAVDP